MSEKVMWEGSVIRMNGITLASERVRKTWDLPEPISPSSKTFNPGSGFGVVLADCVDGNCVIEKVPDGVKVEAFMEATHERFVVGFEVRIIACYEARANYECFNHLNLISLKASSSSKICLRMAFG